MAGSIMLPREGMEAAMAHLAAFPTPRPLYDVDPLFQVAGPAPLVPLSAPPDCPLIVYRRTRAHSLHPPPWPGHSFPFLRNLTVCS